MKNERNNSDHFSEARKYFKNGQTDYYDEILKMRSSKNLSNVIDSIETFVKYKGKGITTGQLRNIYAKVKATKKDVNKAQLIRPVLAYTAARQGTDDAKIVIALLDGLLKLVDDEEKLLNFQTFMESIVGYHKFHHSK